MKKENGYRLNWLFSPLMPAKLRFIYELFLVAPDSGIVLEKGKNLERNKQEFISKSIYTRG